MVGSSPVPASSPPAVGLGVGLGVRHASMPWRGVDGLEACNPYILESRWPRVRVHARQHGCVHTCTAPYLERPRDVTVFVEVVCRADGAEVAAVMGGSMGGGCGAGRRHGARQGQHGCRAQAEACGEAAYRAHGWRRRQTAAVMGAEAVMRAEAGRGGERLAVRSGTGKRREVTRAEVWFGVVATIGLMRRVGEQCAALHVHCAVHCMCMCMCMRLLGDEVQVGRCRHSSVARRRRPGMLRVGDLR